MEELGEDDGGLPAHLEVDPQDEAVMISCEFTVIQWG